jgi:hypothetical protein
MIVWHGRAMIRPGVPSHVAYEVRRKGNDPSKALGQCIHNRKVDIEAVRQRYICQKLNVSNVKLLAPSDQTVLVKVDAMLRAPRGMSFSGKDVTLLSDRSFRT